MSNGKRDLLRIAAERAAGRPFFLAAVLREFQELRGMDDEHLADELGCDPADLPRLGLCRCPDRATDRFRADVERIAARFGLAPLPLARAIRAVDAARKIREAAPSPDAGRLLAARDREPAGDEPSPPEPEARG